MRVFVHDNKTGGTILELCEQYNTDLITEELLEKTDPVNVYEFFMDTIDALILDITKPTQNTQFIIAQALLTEKPMLCLYAKNQTPRRMLEYIRKKRVPRKVKTYGYMEKELPQLISNFMFRFDPTSNAEDDLPSLKFTMRMTPRIDRYVEWYAAKTEITKAHAIRDLLAASARLDPDYQQVVKK